jgi:hypothetical protein
LNNIFVFVNININITIVRSPAGGPATPGRGRVLFVRTVRRPGSRRRGSENRD